MYEPKTEREAREIGSAYAIEQHEKSMCLASPDKPAPGYACTRPANHDGPHVAHDETLKAVAIWTWEKDQ